MANLEVADVVLAAEDGQVRGFAHALRTVEPLDDLAVLRHAEHGRADRVDDDDVALLVDGQSGHDVDVADVDALHELANPFAKTKTKVIMESRSESNRREKEWCGEWAWPTDLAAAREDLHPRALVAAVADDDLAGRADDGHLARIPQLALLLARLAKVVLEVAVFVEHLPFRQPTTTTTTTKEASSLISTQPLLD